MRATVERNAGVAHDPYGGVVPDPVILLSGSGALPCFVQAKMERFIADGQKVMHLARHVLWASLDADLREGDIVTKVVNLRGSVLFPGRRVIRPLVRREDHLEATLEEYS